MSVENRFITLDLPPNDSGNERDAMIAGIDKLQRVLAEAGFAPR